MHLKDGFTAFEIGFVDRDLPVEATRAQEGSIENVGPVGRRQDDDTTVATETVHFHQQLVEGALPFIVAHDSILAAGAPDGIDLVDEDNARRFFAGLLEQVTDTAGADPYEKLHKIGTAHREERYLSFAGHCLGQ